MDWVRDEDCRRCVREESLSSAEGSAEEVDSLLVGWDEREGCLVLEATALDKGGAAACCVAGETLEELSGVWFP